MDNFVYGVQALGSSLTLTILGLMQHPLLWGFGIGFLVSTIIHLIIVADVPRTIPLMVTNNTVELFQKMSPRDERGVFLHSYIALQKEHNRVRIAFYLALTTVLLVILAALFRA